jgi:hypothetical protein
MLYKGRMRHLRMLLLLPLVACGGATPDAPAPVEALSDPGFERGVVLGVRPLPAAPPGEPRLRLVSQVVGAARGAGSAEANPVEIVIRLEAGRRDVVLVQPAEGWLRPGQRVRLTTGPRPVLTREASGA